MINFTVHHKSQLKIKSYKYLKIKHNYTWLTQFLFMWFLKVFFLFLTLKTYLLQAGSFPLLETTSSSYLPSPGIGWSSSFTVFLCTSHPMASRPCWASLAIQEPIFIQKFYLKFSVCFSLYSSYNSSHFARGNGQKGVTYKEVKEKKS